MKTVVLIAVFALVSNSCWSRAVTEESVVSVYDPAVGSHNVYSQIATNLAEKITSPFYRIFGLNNSTNATTKRPFEHIELQDSETNLTNGRDVEELSLEAQKKTDKKPEKVTLFSSYLRVPIPLETSGKVEAISKSSLETFNETRNEVDNDDDFDDEFSLDDVDTPQTQRGPFVYILELMGSIVQLLWGGFLAIFKPSSSSS